jgi:uncharacterized protein YdeI (YjbR/CyaY-like superfamily)
MQLPGRVAEAGEEVVEAAIGLIRRRLEVALCYGWIDGQAKGEDEIHRLQKFTPRAKRSNWSKRDREKALASIESGRMKPAGLVEIERAKQDGRWLAGVRLTDLS